MAAPLVEPLELLQMGQMVKVGNQNWHWWRPSTELTACQLPSEGAFQRRSTPRSPRDPRPPKNKTRERSNNNTKWDVAKKKVRYHEEEHCGPLCATHTLSELLSMQRKLIACLEIMTKGMNQVQMLEADALVACQVYNDSGVCSRVVSF